MQKKVWASFIVLWVLISPLYGQSQKDQWVDSVLNTLDLDGKIGQILIAPVESHDEQTLEKQIALIKKHRVGTVVFKKGSPIAQLNAVNALQQADVPLLIGADAHL